MRRGQEPGGGLCAEYGHQVCRVSEMYMNVFAVQAQLPFLQTRARFHKIYAAKRNIGLDRNLLLSTTIILATDY